MKIKLYLLLAMLIPGTSFAQNCIQSFNSNCWFNGVSAVRSSSDGTKFFAYGGTGPNGNTNATTCTVTNATIKVYDVTASGIVYNAAQSASGNISSFSDFTANNGYFYAVVGSGTSFTVNFKEASGTLHSLGTFVSVARFGKVAGAPNKMIIRAGATSNQAVILDATNPAAPTATTVALPGGALSYDPYHAIAADETESRIYYVATENESGNVVAPLYRYKIKAVTMAGAAVAGWSDVVIQRGVPMTMAVRPTDRRLFARMSTTDFHLDFHGVVVIDKNGNVPTDMNFTDMSLMGNARGTGSEMYRDIAFDANGNIYANLWDHINGPTVNMLAYGIMKFDASGNLDMGFLRNVWNSYGQAAGGGANSFDLTDAGVIIKTTYGAANAYEDHYALSTDHVNANNEEPSIATYSSLPASIANWGYYPLFIGSNGNSSNYRNVQFLYNSGKLIRPGTAQSTIDQNCGLSTPSTVPTPPAPAGGLINCAKTAFISAPTAGTPASIAIRVEINVTGAGTFSPITLSGSGFSLLDPNYTITAATTGVHTFVIPAYYDGSALSTVDIGAGQAGTCTADLSSLPQDLKRVEIEIWTPENCTFKQVGPALK
jgi:hypothetical protein